MAPTWKPQGKDAAVIARAIFASEVTKTVKSFDAFLQRNHDLAKKYDGLVLGSRGRKNLRSNFYKLYDKIKDWERTGKGLFLVSLAILFLFSF